MLSKTNQKLAHELVAKTAQEMAATYYEEAAHDDDFYKYYPKQKQFINREWPRFIAHARHVLATMLGRADLPEWQKDQIHDALIKHASLPGNIDRRVAKKVIDLGDGNIAQVH